MQHIRIIRGRAHCRPLRRMTRPTSTEVLQTSRHDFRFHERHAHPSSPFGNAWFGIKAEGFARFFGTPTFFVSQKFTKRWRRGRRGRCGGLYQRFLVYYSLSMSIPDFGARRRVFRKLHESGCFVIPNPWDICSARYLWHLGFKALATTSAGFVTSFETCTDKVR